MSHYTIEVTPGGLDPSVLVKSEDELEERAEVIRKATNDLKQELMMIIVQLRSRSRPPDDEMVIKG